MATGTKPTNEHIVEMLTRVLRELDEVKQAQARLAAELREVAKRNAM